MTTATQTQIRRDTSANIAAATPAEGELFYDKTNKRIGVGDGTTAGGFPHAAAADVQKQTFTYATVGGTANAITLTNTPPRASLVAGQRTTFKATSTCTGAVTVNEDGLGVKNAQKMNNGALAATISGDLVSGGIYDLFWDGTQYQIKGLGEGPFSSGAMKFLGSATASSSATIDLTSLLSATYDDYVIYLDNITMASGTRNLLMQCSPDNSTFDAGSNYAYSIMQADSSGATNTVHSGGASSFALSGGAFGNISGKVNLFGVNTASVYKHVTAETQFINGSSYYEQDRFGGSWINTSNSLEAVRFSMSSGNIASGTFRVYGITKS